MPPVLIRGVCWRSMWDFAMPAHKRLTNQQIDASMQKFRAQRLRLRSFALKKAIPIPIFRRLFKE